MKEHPSAIALFTLLSVLLRASSSVAWSISIPNGTARAVAVDALGNVVAAGQLDSSNPGGVDAVVVKVSGSTGTEIWRHVVASGGIDTVVIDAAGDVLAGGAIVGASILKLSGVTGNEEWRYVLPGGRGEIHSVALDTAGNVLAGGMGISFEDTSFDVVKLAAKDGVELWRRQLPPSGLVLPDAAVAVAVDADNNIVAGGLTARSTTAGVHSAFTVLMFEGTTGRTLWHHRIQGSGLANERCSAVAVDRSGNVAAVGETVNRGIGKDFTVAKLDAATGHELWRRVVGGSARMQRGKANAVQIAGNGDVVAAGFVLNASTGPDFAVVKLSGATGRRRWRQVLMGSRRNAGKSGDYATALALDAAGDVVAVGSLRNRQSIGSTDLVVTKIARASGRVRWRRSVSSGGPGQSRASAVAIGPDGGIFVSGVVESPSGHDFTVMHLAGNTGQSDASRIGDSATPAQ